MATLTAPQQPEHPCSYGDSFSSFTLFPQQLRRKKIKNMMDVFFFLKIEKCLYLYLYLATNLNLEVAQLNNSALLCKTPKVDVCVCFFIFVSRTSISTDCAGSDGGGSSSIKGRAGDSKAAIRWAARSCTQMYLQTLEQALVHITLSLS